MLAVADANNSSFYKNSFICFSESMHEYLWDTLYICTCILTTKHGHMNNIVRNNDQSSGHFCLGNCLSQILNETKYQLPYSGNACAKRPGVVRAGQGRLECRLWRCNSLCAAGLRLRLTYVLTMTSQNPFMQHNTWSVRSVVIIYFYINILIDLRFIYESYQTFTPHTIETCTGLLHSEPDMMKEHGTLPSCLP